MLALQTKRRCIHCGNIGRPELSGSEASFIGAVFWGALIISFFVPVLFFATGLLLLWMFFTRQVVCQHCGKELLTYEEVRSTYTKDEYDDDNSSSYQDYTNKKDNNLHKKNNTNNKASVENKHMKAGWLIFNVIAIVVVGVLLKLMIISDGVNPISIIIKSSPDLILAYIADTAGIYVFSLFFGLFGFLYKPHRGLGFILASWAGLFFIIYVSFLR